LQERSEIRKSHFVHCDQQRFGNRIAAPGQVLEWAAAAGDYEITALDNHGRAGSRSLVVR
jgi:hypothetical protein